MATARPIGPSRTTPSRRLRADAERNHDRLLAAAADAFATKGVEVTLREIAERTALSSATVFRHFRSKEELITAVIERRVDELTAAIEHQATETPDPGAALAATVVEVVRSQVRDRPLAVWLAEARSASGENLLQHYSHRVNASVERVLARAQEAGAVRPDVIVDDVMGLTYGAACAYYAEPRRRGALNRHVEVVLDGLRAGPRRLRPPEAPSAK